MRKRATLIFSTNFLRETMEKPKSANKKSLKGVLYVPPHARTEAGTANPQPVARKKKSVKKENSTRMCDDSSRLFKENDSISKETHSKNSVSHRIPNSSDWQSQQEYRGNRRSSCFLPGIDANSMKEIKNRTGNVEIASPSDVFISNSHFEQSEDGDTASIIEIYGFPEEFKTIDLLNTFSNFVSRGFVLKWVDNTHALGIFPSTLMADEALSANLPNVKTRPIHKGTPISRELAAILVLPSALRPKTCSIENRTGNVTIASPCDVFISNSDFEQSEDRDTASIIEIYDFPEEFKTIDLLNTFSNFVSRGFVLKWVDNTHALGIFPSTLMADEALSANLPNVKTRPIHKGTPISRELAAILVLPSALRPKTCSIENRTGNVKIASPSDVFISNSDFEQSEDRGTASIIEIYDFPEEFKTIDLLNTFSNFVSKGFVLKWVDNTHALGIFSSTLMADEALSVNLPNVKTRPIHEGTPISRKLAAILVLPSSIRPKTCSVMAKRLVSSALGLKQTVSAEECEKEKKLLEEAREQRRLRR